MPVTIDFKTVHRSKGLEADYVIVADMCSGKHGFPSETTDDPILDIVLATPEGRRLHARLSLIAAGLGLRPLADGDEVARKTLRSLPLGLAAFSIEGDHGATIWFDHGSADNAAGWGEPPRRPEVRVTFADMTIAYAVMRDEIDTLAAVGCGQIKVEGLVPLADGLSVVMERLRIYLQPVSP